MPAVHPAAGSKGSESSLGEKEAMAGEVPASDLLKGPSGEANREGDRKAEPRARLNKIGSNAPENLAENKAQMGALTQRWGWGGWGCF